MRDYSKVSPKLWRSPRFRSLESGDARLFYLFFLTCEHQSSAGCFRLPVAYAASDLGWTEERFQMARSALVEAELLVSRRRHGRIFRAALVQAQSGNEREAQEGHRAADFRTGQRPRSGSCRGRISGQPGQPARCRAAPLRHAERQRQTPHKHALYERSEVLAMDTPLIPLSKPSDIQRLRPRRRPRPRETPDQNQKRDFLLRPRFSPKSGNRGQEERGLGRKTLVKRSAQRPCSPRLWPPA